MDLVSIIMPTHNGAQWVCKTLDNLNAQTYPHIELIVIDDASQDETVSIVRRKLETESRYSWQIIELTGNGGPSAARNIGLRAATGSWVQFLDCDDFLAPAKIETQMAYCAGAPSDVSGVYSPWRMGFFDDGKPTWVGPMISPDMEGKAPIMYLVGNDRPLHGAGLARRSALQEIGGFDEALRFWEFEEISVRLAKVGRLEAVRSSEPFYLWRLHRDKFYIGGDSARYKSTGVALGWLELVLNEAGARSLDQMGLSAADRRSLLDYCTIWGRLLYAQDKTAFRQYVAMAQRLDPKIAPTHPRYVAALSSHVGYEAAEAVARLVMLPKRLAQTTLRGLKVLPQSAVYDWN